MNAAEQIAIERSDKRYIAQLAAKRFGMISATLSCIRERHEAADGQLIDSLALIEQFADWAQSDLDDVSEGAS